MRSFGFKLVVSAFAALCLWHNVAEAQVTTGAISGTVTGDGASPVSGVRVIIVHEPSGTRYVAVTRDDGHYIAPAVRIGGPYKVTAQRIGFQPQSQDSIDVDLGVTSEINFQLSTTAVTLQSISVTGEAGTISSAHTGAATQVSGEAIAAFPTISRLLTDFTRLAPQASGSSFAGMSANYNNITIDGAYFNNQFGLASQPGGRTGVSPIPIEAVDQIQVNIAPFDVRQGWFVGAGLNAVTKSGTNEMTATAYYNERNQDYVGSKIDGVPFNPGTQSFQQRGFAVSGPVIKDKLFYFVSFEDDKFDVPATTFLSNTGSQTIAGNTTRVLQSDLDGVSSFLQKNFGWVSGPYQQFNNETPSARLLYRVDWNINDRNKLSFRYNKLDSDGDNLISNSTSLGAGNRRTNLNAMSFQNSGYSILENIRSGVVELNSQVSNNVSNNLLVGYTMNDESRGYKSPLFPTIDILQNGTDYITAGMDPFTPDNQLRYHTFQLQNNMTFYKGAHAISAGVTYEKYHSDNVFYQGDNSVYVYNSLQDFYTDLNDYLANPNRTTSPIKVNHFQVQYVNVPGMSQPLQPLDVQTYGGYLQDVWRASSKLTVTYGSRIDIVTFGNTAIENPAAALLTFNDPNGNPIHLHTGQLPATKPLFSPRVGFNWDVNGDRKTQVRGGTGIFTGKPEYVWISNQVGNNGMLTGAIDVTNTSAYPFNPDPNHYHVLNPTGQPAASYAINATDPNYSFPQQWRSDIAVDQKLPLGLIGTVEFIYGKDINGQYYYNANLPAPAGNMTGADTRPYWNTANFANRINANVTNAIVIKNESVGYNYSESASLERAFENGFYVKAGFNYGVSMNTHDPGSTAATNWGSNQISGNPNQAQLAYSAFSPGHREFLALSYGHTWFGIGRTTISLFNEGFTQGNDSYWFSADANGDGQTNDLIYIPKNMGEMNFVPFTSSGTTFTAAQQATAWEAYIEQDKYLSAHRGQYAERGAVFLPELFRTDLSISQDIGVALWGKRNALQVRLDILNFGNMLNNRWGVSQRLVSDQPLIPKGRDASGALTYNLRNFGTQLINTTFQSNAGLNDAYRMQLGFRYTMH